MIKEEILKRYDELKRKYTVVAFAQTSFVHGGYIFVQQSATLGIGFADQQEMTGYRLNNINKPDIVDENLMVITYTRSSDSIAFVGDLETIKDLAVAAATNSGGDKTMDKKQLADALVELETNYQIFMSTEEKETIKTLKLQITSNDVSVENINAEYLALKTKVDNRKASRDKMKPFVDAHFKAERDGTTKPLKDPAHWQLDHAVGQNDFEDKKDS